MVEAKVTIFLIVPENERLVKFCYKSDVDSIPYTRGRWMLDVSQNVETVTKKWATLANFSKQPGHFACEQKCCKSYIQRYELIFPQNIENGNMYEAHPLQKIQSLLQSL